MSPGPEKKRPDTALPIPSKETDDADIQGMEEDYGGGKSKLPLTLSVIEQEIKYPDNKWATRKMPDGEVKSQICKFHDA